MLIIIHQNVDKLPQLNNLIKKFIKSQKIHFTAITAPEGERGTIICSGYNLDRLLDELSSCNIFVERDTTIEVVGEYSEISGKREFVSLYLEAKNRDRVLHLGQTGIGDFTPEDIRIKNEALSKMHY